MGSDDSGASEHVISQLLTEMDGIEALVNVVVIGASKPARHIDPAILTTRPVRQAHLRPSTDHAPVFRS